MKLTKSDIQYFVNKVAGMGFFHLLSANVLIQLFAFASQLFVAGILSPDDLGRIKIIQTYLSIFSVIAGMGFNASTLKICSENRTSEENAGYFNTALIFTIASTAFFYIVILLLNAFNIFTSDVLLKMLIPMGLFPVISNTLFLLYISFFQARKEVKLFSTLTVYNKLISIIAIIVFSWLWGIKGYYIAFNLSFILMIFIAVKAIRKFHRFRIDKNFREKLKGHWFYAKSNILASVFGETSGMIDVILISFLISNMEDIGYYSFALTLTIALRIFPATVQQITIPYFSSFDSTKESFLIIYRKYNRLLSIVVVVSLALFLLAMPVVLSLVFRGKYDNSVTFLYFLAIGWSIRNVNQLQSAAIFGLGKIKYNAVVGLIVLIFNLIAYPIFIHYFGIIGAAYASIPSGIVFWLSSRFYMQKAIRETNWKI